jgi:hypothetical protein
MEGRELSLPSIPITRRHMNNKWDLALSFWESIIKEFNKFDTISGAPGYSLDKDKND